MKKDGAQLAVGDKAPAFRAVAVGGEYGDGREVSLGDFVGAPVVLYFYPKDDTPGCTVQACSLRDSWSSLRGLAKVFGISVDSTKSHAKFIEKFQLPFPLLSDSEKEMVNAYGVWVEKSMYGKKYMGILRSAFLVDEKGKVAEAWYKVSPKDTPKNLLAALDV